MPRTPPLYPLHLLRLAESAPGQWVRLPGSSARVMRVTAKAREVTAGYLLCLSGEAVIDFPSGAFVRLREGEAFQVAQGAWAALAVAEETTLLLLPDG